MKAFRIVVDKRGTNHIQEKQNTLFGFQWATVFTFNSTCDQECSEVVKLLNLCHKKTNKK